MDGGSSRIIAVVGLLIFVGALKLTDSAVRESMGLDGGDSILGMGLAGDGHIRVSAMGSGVSLGIPAPKSGMKGLVGAPGLLVENIYGAVRGLIQEEISRFPQNR